MRILIIIVLLSKFSFAQTSEKFLTDFLLESELKSENVLNNYNQYDFSKIWTITENSNVLGIIGKDIKD